MESSNDNYLREFGTLDPSVYSKKKFIDYIVKLLVGSDGVEGALGTVKTYEFVAGKDIKIATTSISDSVDQVVVSYEESDDPTLTVPSLSYEYGVPLAAGALTLTVTIKRGTYTITSFTITGIDTPVSMSIADFYDLLEGETTTVQFTNGAVGGTDTVVATATVQDYNGSSASKNVTITRQYRQFYGTLSSNTPYLSHTTLHDSMESVLGDLSGYITVNHGTTDTYLIIATTEDIEVYASGFRVTMDQYTVQVSPYEGDTTILKSYNVYVSEHTLTGSYTYEIRT